MLKSIAAGVVALAISLTAHAEMNDEVLHLQQQWDVIKYRTPEKGQEEAFAKLVESAAKVVAAHPDEAEPLIWKGIILASYAGAKGGLGALSVIKEAKTALEEAMRIDDKALSGSAYTTLGSIYYQVPGWPLGFGDDDKAREYLLRALILNPDGLDSNFWYGAFLFEQREYEKALDALNKAKAAQDRPGRALADAGRRGEIEALIARIGKKLKRH